MKHWMPFVGLGIALVWAAGCVVSSGTNTAATSSTSAAVPAKGAAPVMSINGEEVYAADLLSSPLVRGFLRQYIFSRAVEQEAAAQGVTVDPALVDERIEAVKQSVYDNGEEWDLYLAEQAITDAEFRETMHNSLLFDALVETRIDLSDAKLREVFDEERTEVVNAYMRNHHYPDSMRSSVTFEDCRETVKEKIKRRDGFPIMDELNKRLLRDATIEVLCMESEEDADTYEYLILEIINDQLRREEEAAAAAAEAASTFSVGEAEPAGSEEGAEDSIGAEPTSTE